ncbi:MAG: hypothetical protein U0572_04190 [Phycisphaerales bacterium]
MEHDDDRLRAEPEQLEVLAQLVARARSLGLHTGLRNDEVHELGQDEVCDLIEQLRQRLGDQKA